MEIQITIITVDRWGPQCCFPECLSNTPWQRMGGVEVKVPALLTAALGGGEDLASCLGRFTHDETSPVTTGQDVRWTPETIWTWWRHSPFLKEWLANPHQNIILGVLQWLVIWHVLRGAEVSGRKFALVYQTRMFSSLPIVHFLGTKY
jgi:hypothetical protein